MSKVAIQGNASGTGTFTIQSPATNTDRVLTLPDEAGTVLTSGGAIDVNASAPADSVAIDSSGNVGIGTSTPSSFYSLADNLVVGTGSGGNGLTIYSGSADSAYIGFNDTASAGMQGFIQYNHNGDYMAFAPNGTEKARIDSSGNLLVGTTSIGGAGGVTFQRAISEGCTQQVFNRSDAGANNSAPMIFRNGGSQVGFIQFNNSGTQFGTSSDYRLKENVVDMTGAIDRVKALKPSQFNFIVNPDIVVDGFLAHEVQDIVPEAVSGEKDAVDAEGNPEYQGIDQSKLVPLLTGALQEAIARIETLEAEVATLKGASA